MKDKPTKEQPTFVLYIDTENAAFDVENGGGALSETARILRKVADRLDDGELFDTFQTLFDFNGNDVGRAAFKVGARVVTR